MEQKNQKSWRTTYLIILTIVTIICIIIGIIWRLQGHYHGVLREDDLKKTDKMTELSFDGFDSVNLELSVGDMDIVYGDGYQVLYNYPEKLKPQVKVKGDTLVVTQKTKSDFNFIGFDNLSSFSDLDYDLIITIPKDAKLKDVFLSLDMGAVSLEDMEMNNLTIEADMGNVELSNSSCTNITANADMGNIEMENVTFMTAECDADMGSIEILNSDFQFAECDADMGSIEISGNFEAVAAECSMGSVSVDTDKDLETVGLDLSADMGSVTVNGKNKGNLFCNGRMPHGFGDHE